MRKGENISKEQLLTKSTINHRIIIPIHIPRLEGYYTESFSVFEMCLNSIQKTSVYDHHISVVSDGCCKAVNDRLYEFVSEKKIDELIIETENIGKINAILKVLRTVEEDYVTITDADILFLHQWDTEVFNVFKAFKKAAVVSPIPVFRKQLSYTANIWLDYLWSSKLQFRPVKNPIALEKFAQSIGWNSLEDRFKDVIVTLKENNVTSVVSAVHCVATYKTAYLKHSLPNTSSAYKLGGHSEGDYLDQPPYESDGYRLSTYNNYAYHVGNVIEPWMVEVYANLNDITPKITLPDIETERPKLKPLKRGLQKLFLLALKQKTVYNYLLLKKGLTQTQLKTFWYT